MKKERRRQESCSLITGYHNLIKDSFKTTYIFCLNCYVVLLFLNALLRAQTLFLFRKIYINNFENFQQQFI